MRARPRGRGRAARARTRCPTSLRRRRRTSCALHEVDVDGYAVELEALAQLVLDPVRVVARDEARLVDEDPDPRRARLDLRPVQEVQAAACLRGRLAALAQFGEEVVELRRRDACSVLLEQLLHRVEQA